MRVSDYILKNIAKHTVIQGSHKYKITSYYKVIYEAADKEFNEDNDPTLKSVLLECFLKSINLSNKKAIKYLSTDGDIMKNKEVNYVVSVSGRSDIDCDTVAEVWRAVGKGSFGSLYSVSSPSGKSVSQFIPF